MSEQENNEITALLQQILSRTESMEARLLYIEERLDSFEEKQNTNDSRLSILEGEDQLNVNEKASTDNEKKEDDHNDPPQVPKAPKSDKDDKRKSAFMKAVSQTTALAERRQVVVQMATPSHSKVWLSSTELSEYCRFVNNWFDWEIKHGIKLEPTLIIADHVRTTLMYNNDMSEQDFSDLRPEDFCTLMAKETQVLSKVQFHQTFKHALRDIKVLLWERVKPNSHELFFQGVLRRKKIYLRTFQILMEANSKFCPDLEGKEFGLAQIFLSLFDPEYNKLVLAEIPKVKQANYKKIEDFVDAYVAKAKEHFDTSKLIWAVPYKGDDFQRFSTTNRFGKFQTQRYSGNTNNTGNRADFAQSKPLYQPKDTRTLNFIDVNEERDYSDEEEQDICSNSPPLNDNPKRETLEELEELLCEEGTTPEPPPEDIATAHQHLQALESNNSSQVARGCVNYTLYGRCFKGADCKYASGHTDQAANETRKWMMSKLQNPQGAIRTTSSQGYRPSATAPPRKIIQREKPSRDFE